MDFQLLIEDWSKYYYSAPLLLMLEFLAAILFLRTYKFDVLRKAFFIYLLSDLIVLIIGAGITANKNINPQKELRFLGYLNYLVSTIELLVYSYFFSLYFNSKKATRLLSFLFFISTIYSILILIKQFHIKLFILIKSITIFATINYTILLSLSIFYFITILKEESKLTLHERPTFWIVTGLFFYATFSILFSLFHIHFYSSKYKNLEYIAAIFYYLPFMVNIFFLLKANACKKPFTI